MINIEKIYSDFLEGENKKTREKYKDHKGWFSASAAGTCHRKQLYRKNGVEEAPMDDRVKRLLRLGTIVHADIEAAINKNHDENPEIDIYTEQRIEIPELKVIGHLDIAVQDEDKLYVYDVKTCASYKWRMKFGRKPDKGGSTNYQLQIGTYAMGFGNELHIDDIEMSLLWYNKDTSAMREEKVDSHWLDRAFEYWVDLNEETKDKKPEELTPGSYGVPMMNWECKYCGYKDIHCPGN